MNCTLLRAVKHNRHGLLKNLSQSYADKGLVLVVIFLFLFGLENIIFVEDYLMTDMLASSGSTVSETATIDLR